MCSSGGKVGMITLKINGLDVSVEEGSTLLEAARFIGFPIPTLCHMDGLSPYGACRLCVVVRRLHPLWSLCSNVRRANDG